MNNYGAKLPKTDLRDYKINADNVEVTSFILGNLPKTKNQGTISSCTAHAASSMLEWFYKREIGEYRELSTGFIYGMQAVLSNRLSKGMHLRDACKIAQKYGDCLFETMPYNIEMPECYERLKNILNDEVYKEAAISKIDSYAKCETNETIKYAIIKYSPVLMSIRWYNKYELDDNNVIHFDTTSGRGCHAIMVYGFNEKGWLCQNSWGKNWGNNGRFILPYEYGFIEAWSFVDAKNNDIYKPKQNKFLNVIYQIINCIINAFSSIINLFKKKDEDVK